MGFKALSKQQIKDNNEKVEQRRQKEKVLSAFCAIEKHLKEISESLKKIAKKGTPFKHRKELYYGKKCT